MNGTVQRLRLPPAVPAAAQVVVIHFSPTIRLEADGLASPSTEDGQKASISYSVHRGALMFSLPLNLTIKQTAHYYAESNDYEVSCPGFEEKKLLSASLTLLRKRAKESEGERQ